MISVFPDRLYVVTILCCVIYPSMRNGLKIPALWVRLDASEEQALTTSSSMRPVFRT